MTLSNAILKEIHHSFSPEDTGPVIQGLSNTSADIARSERIQFAILKLAKGNMKEFNKALSAASLDWRDVLVAAGMAEMDWPDVVIVSGMTDKDWHPTDPAIQSAGTSQANVPMKVSSPNPIMRFIIRWVIILGGLAVFVYGAIWILAHPDSPMTVVFIVGIGVLYFLGRVFGVFNFLKNLFNR